MKKEDWFEEGGCKELSEMESGSGRGCWQSGVNPSTLVYGVKTGSKLDWWWWTTLQHLFFKIKHHNIAIVLYFLECKSSSWDVKQRLKVPPQLIRWSYILLSDFCSQKTAFVTGLSVAIQFKNWSVFFSVVFVRN